MMLSVPHYIRHGKNNAVKSKQRTNTSKIIQEKLSPSVLWDVFTFPLSFSNAISYAQIYDVLVSRKINCKKKCSMIE